MIDTTLVCPLGRDGTAKRGAASRDEFSLTAARQRTERTFPELSGKGRALGGRWSDETAQFLQVLAKSNAANAPALMRSRSKAAWLRRWGSILACIAALAFTVSLLQQCSAPGTGRYPPSEQEVLRDSRLF